MKKDKFTLNYLFVSFFYSGSFPVAPGTFASFATLPFVAAYFYFVPHDNFINISLTLILLMLLYFFSCRSIDKYLQKTGGEDPKEVVIDEFIGQFISFLPLSAQLHIWLNNFNENKLIIALSFILGFLFFRIFDILKPWIVGWADKNIKGGRGVMLDDVFAGIFASICSFCTLFAISKLLT